MRRSLVLLLALGSFLMLFHLVPALSKSTSLAKYWHAHAAAVKAGAAKTSSDDGWPESRAATIARGWVEAFSAGEPSFRAYLGKALTPESLAKKSLDQRMVTYRELRERFGKLSFASVVKSSTDKLEVRLMASDGSLHEFTFEIQNAPPFKLIQVSRLDRRRQHHGFGGFHH